MNDLIESLKKTHANNFAFYMMAQGYHWNVEGILFSQFHDFFGDLYEDVQGAVDPLAEEIRALGEYAPFTMEQLDALRTIRGGAESSNPVDMLNALLSANGIMIASLTDTFKLASDLNKQGLADFIAGRLDAHEKHGWMLRSHLK
jgi:starvation-inducible DNA-binding protein